MVKRISECVSDDDPARDEPVKSCAACHRYLPARDFTVNKRTKTGLSAYCRPCWNTKQRAYHAEWMKDPAFREKRREKYRDWQQANKDLCKTFTRKYYEAHRDEISEKAKAKRQPRVYERQPCAMCGATYTPRRSNSLTCSNTCRSRLYYQRNRIKRAELTRKRRAARRGLVTEDFSLADIAERDRWHCQICGSKVDRDLKWPHKQCATMDHIVPIKLDGDHSRANCQLAHADCNRRKGARIREPQQLMLIG